MLAGVSVLAGVDRHYNKHIYQALYQVSIKMPTSPSDDDSSVGSIKVVGEQPKPYTKEEFKRMGAVARDQLSPPFLSVFDRASRMPSNLPRSARGDLISAY